MADLHARTDVHGLFVAGETACTGLHGANRLASNSLLECLVFAHNAVLDSASKKNLVPGELAIPAYANHKTKTDADELDLIAHLWDEIRRIMWAYVGIVRTNR